MRRKEEEEKKENCCSRAGGTTSKALQEVLLDLKNKLYITVTIEAC